MPLPMHSQPSLAAGTASRSRMALGQNKRPYSKFASGASSGASKSNASGSGSGKEGIVQRLQRALVDVRRDRDHEHRLCEIAREKLRAAKQAFREEQSSFEEDKKKVIESQTELTKTEEEIVRIQARIQELQQKYQFQHDDLIRKREKIQQQNSAQEAATSRRNKSLLAVRRCLDQQRDKYQKFERMQDHNVKELIGAIASDALAKHRRITSARRQHDGTKESSTTTPALVDAGTKEGRDSTNQEFGQGGSTDGDFSFDFEKYQEALGIKQEEILAREFKTIDDYAVLPKMILSKAETLRMESELLRAEATRLEALIVQQQELPTSSNRLYPRCQQEQKERNSSNARIDKFEFSIGTHTSTDAGSSSTSESIHTATMDARDNANIEGKDGSRRILDGTMDLIESTTENSKPKGTQRKESQTVLPNDATILNTESLHPESSEIEGEKSNDARPACTPKITLMDTTDLSNQVQDSNKAKGSSDPSLDSGNAAGDQSEGRDVNISGTSKASALKFAMNPEHEGDGSTASALTTNANSIEIPTGIQVGGNDSSEDFPPPTLQNTPINVIKRHEGSGSEDENRTM